MLLGNTAGAHPSWLVPRQCCRQRKQLRRGLLRGFVRAHVRHWFRSIGCAGSGDLNDAIKHGVSLAHGDTEDDFRRVASEHQPSRPARFLAMCRRPHRWQPALDTLGSSSASYPQAGCCPLDAGNFSFTLL